MLVQVLAFLKDPLFASTCKGLLLKENGLLIMEGWYDGHLTVFDWEAAALRVRRGESMEYQVVEEIESEGDPLLTGIIEQALALASAQRKLREHEWVFRRRVNGT